MTYSIVARDAVTGELGCAVQSHFFAVGQVVPWAEPGVGAVATQAHAEVSYGPRGLELMRAGEPPGSALRTLVAEDDQAAHRQVAMVDASGAVSAHTGELCIAEAGDVQGDGVSAQANMMWRSTVPGAMLRAYEEATGDLAGRLLAALDAAQAEGGDIRGRQSAALLVVDGEGTSAPGHRVADLRVDDHGDPLGELRRLLELRRAYDAVERAERAALSGDLDTAVADFAAAEANASDNQRAGDEATFWHGVSLAAAGDVARAREVLAGPFGAHRGWRVLLRRLPATGALPADPSLLAQLLDE